jgi:hypothetical protein
MNGKKLAAAIRLDYSGEIKNPSARARGVRVKTLSK